MENEFDHGDGDNFFCGDSSEDGFSDTGEEGEGKLSGYSNPLGMPLGYKKRLGDIRVWKADIGDVKVISWDAIPPCRGEVCSIWGICSKRGKEVSKRHCGVVHEYLGNVNEMIFRNYYNQLTEPMLFKIGMHLIPLYKQLCRLKIEELAVENLVHIVSGRYLIHPIMKEIRETVKDIEKVWSSLGLEVREGDSRSVEEYENEVGRIVREAVR